jgi:hypothetical protein
MHEALCRPSSTTLDMVHAEDGPPITQRTSGLIDPLIAAEPPMCARESESSVGFLAQYLAQSPLAVPFFPGISICCRLLRACDEAGYLIRDVGSFESKCQMSPGPNGRRYMYRFKPDILNHKSQPYRHNEIWMHS